MKNEESYFNREQSQIKHLILEKYLSRFAHIVGSRWSGIIYVDGFAGPWNVTSNDFSDSSFAIALRELRKARGGVHKAFKEKYLDIECIFLERDPTAFKSLEDYSKKQKDVRITAINAEFEEAIPQLIRVIEAKKSNHFPFVLIDPKGWKGFAMDVIAPLIRQKPCEILINFMTGHIIRFIEDERDGVKASFQKLFGDDSYTRKIEGLSGHEREDATVEAYAERIKQVGGYAYVSTALVLQPTRDRTHFHLIYATRDLRGLDVFKKAERQALDLSKTLRSDAKIRSRVETTGQAEFFAGSDLPDVGYLESLQKHYEEKAEKALDAFIAGREFCAYDDLYAIALSFPTVQESPFLREWIKRNGAVPTLGKRRFPKIKMNDRVVFTP